MEQWAANSVEKRKVEDLIPYDRNPKQHPDTQIDELVNSIQQWGWTIPILIDESDVVIAGHGRLYAAQKMEIKEVPCIIAKDWSEDKKRAYVIADNKLSERGDWDNAVLYSELKSLSDVDFDLSLIGMSDVFSQMDFSPNLSPDSSFLETSSNDFADAQKAIDKQIEGASNEKHKDGIEVICPHCAEEFTISGY